MFKIGDRVRVRTGSMTGRTGEVVSTRYDQWDRTTWYTVKVDSKTVCNGPSQDFEKVKR